MKRKVKRKFEYASYTKPGNTEKTQYRNNSVNF